MNLAKVVDSRLVTCFNHHGARSTSTQLLPEVLDRLRARVERQITNELLDEVLSLFDHDRLAIDFDFYLSSVYHGQPELCPDMCQSFT